MRGGQGWPYALAYNALLLALRGAYSVFSLPSVLRGGDALERRQRLGRIAPWSGEPPLWMQAASVGEVGVASLLRSALRGVRPALPIYLTTTTRTGQMLASRIMDRRDGLDGHGFFPLDFPRTVRKTLTALRPRALLLVETEIWPNLLAEAGRRGLPALVANGRISDRAFRRYRLAAPLLARALQRVRWVGVQTPLDRDRFVALGIPEDRVAVTGNLKFAAPPAGSDPAPLLADLGVGTEDELWLGGSTAEGEEEALLSAFRRVAPPAAGFRVLVLAPRRPERFDAVGALLAESGFPWRRRSAPAEGPWRRERRRVLLLDSLGELSSLYGRATIAFVGGSLAPLGGHNILEPASSGVAPVFGPSVQNFREAARLLLDAGGGFQVEDAAGLGDLLERLAIDPDLRREAGERARKAVQANAGSLEVTVRAILPYLPQEGAREA